MPNFTKILLAVVSLFHFCVQKNADFNRRYAGLSTGRKIKTGIVELLMEGKHTAELISESTQYEIPCERRI
jgi:hypothetical protein